MKSKYSLFVLSLTLVQSLAMAAPVNLRWTNSDDPNAAYEHIIAVLNQKTGFNLTPASFAKVEERDLATSHYQFYTQNVDGTPIQGTTLRVWSKIGAGDAIQVEASVENPAPVQQAALSPAAHRFKALDNAATLNRLVFAAMAGQEDGRPGLIAKSTTYWKDGELVQVVKVRAQHGYHTVTVSLARNKVIAHRYDPFPQDDEYSLQALLYPIYEEAETVGGTILPRASLDLKYIKSAVRKGNGTDPFAALRTQKYFFSMFDPVRGLTDDGRKQGFWSMTYIKQQAAALVQGFGLSPNTIDTGAAILEGRYATINIHPAAKNMQGVTIPLNSGLQFRPDYVFNEQQGDTEMVPTATLLGKPMESQAEVLARPARRLPNHDPVQYLNDGFDELQVYYSINALMESLHAMGFSDPELSTRPFNAFLYDPDISMRDNAYYTDDTINFTTYSPKAPNFARDNSTIWHELGHGIMDRLMGDSIVLADTGGLSEGMADFVASLVIADRMQGQTYPGMNDYRIINNTGFHLTNEVHDDGESYGGTMDDLKNAAIARDGQAGLSKVTDLTLETMRLTRNNPGLTASGWFSHMLFADERGSDLRAPGELHDLIVAAFSDRNFSLDDGVKLADFSLKYNGTEIAAGVPGSRDHAIKVPSIGPIETADYKLDLQLTDGDIYKFKFPVTVKVFFRSGPLQGAIHWVGEEAEPKLLTIEKAGDIASLNVTVTGTCDEINREDGSCVDFAYVQIWNNDPQATKPVSKKRFYLQVKPQN